MAPGLSDKRKRRVKPVRTLPRFRCDFCTKVLTRSAMERHELICWKNPNRYCEMCENRGEVDEGDGYYSNMIPCYYCSQFDESIATVSESADFQP